MAERETARHVRWILTQHLAGHSLASIARTLSEALALQSDLKDPCLSGWLRTRTDPRHAARKSNRGR